MRNANTAVDGLISFLNTAPNASESESWQSMAERLGLVLRAHGDRGLSLGDTLRESGMARPDFLKALDDAQRLRIVEFAPDNANALRLTEAAKSLFND